MPITRPLQAILSFRTIMKLAGLLGVVGVVGAIAAWVIFVPQRPSPSGPRAVGRIELTLRSAGGQPLPSRVWYPAQGSGSGTSPVENAPLHTATPLPVILYSPGWSGHRSQNSILAENLASHGYVVVGCDDYTNDAAADPDHGAMLELATEEEMIATLDRGRRHVETQAARLLDVLRALDGRQSSFLDGRLNLTRIGILGYSVGGAAGLQAALIEPRVAAVINLDGGLFGPPASTIGTEAYFLMSARGAFPSEAELASTKVSTRNYALLSAMDIPRNNRRMERRDSYWLHLPAADHGDLSDALFSFSRVKLFRTNFERRAMNTAIAKHKVAFFNSVLLGDDKALRGLVGRNDQTVRWISSTSPPLKAARDQQ